MSDKKKVHQWMVSLWWDLFFVWIIAMLALGAVSIVGTIYLLLTLIF